MQDGYYLSTYLFFDELASHLNVKLRHDQNVSLWKKDGGKISLIHYWELERISGYKQHGVSLYDKEKTIEFLNLLLEEYDLDTEKLAGIWGTPGLDTSVDYHSIDDYPSIAYHSISHLFTSLLMDYNKFKNNTILALAVDGAPDNVVEKDAFNKNYYSGAVSKAGEIEVFSVSSPGRLWSYSKRIFGLREGTLMALASASKSEIEYEINEPLYLEDQNSYEIAKQFVDEVILKVNKAVEENNIINGLDSNFSIEENKISMVMKIIQKMSDLIMDANVKHAINKYNLDPKKTILSISGGYALNCPTNSYLMNRYGFEEFLAPPCVSDTGLSLGIGLYAFYKYMKDDLESIEINFPYLGDQFTFIKDTDEYKEHIKVITPINFKTIVEDIKSQPIVWFYGRAEIGPRALGHRSILADPRTIASKEYLNEVKQREWWRPVAPIVLEDKAKDFFEDSDTSPFMLRTYKIKEDKLEKIPAISHLNQTARVQTINKKDNEVLYKIIEYFEADTGIPILCNTSLNDKGEPIINNIQQAMNFAIRKNFKVIYVNTYRIELVNHHQFGEKEPSKRLEYFFSPSLDKEDIERINPHNISSEELTCYFDNVELMESLDLNNKRDVRKLALHTKSLANRFGNIFDRD